MLEIFKPVLVDEFITYYTQKRGVWVKDEAEEHSYVDNFSIQWKEFRKTQLDSQTGVTQTEDRLFSCSGWHPESLKNKLVLEIGSGAGRFTEVLLKYGAHVVSIDLSNAIFENSENNKSDRLLLIKEDLYNLPLKRSSFDFVLCYGVIQHTPNPVKSYKVLVEYCKPYGMCSFDQYTRLNKPSQFGFPKYLWRPLTTRVPPRLLLKALKLYIPVYLPIDSFIKNIPVVGNRLTGCIPIPCINYTNFSDMKSEGIDPVEWAVMDTFDALGAKYDYPWSRKEMMYMAKSLPVRGYMIGHGGNGLVLNTFGNKQRA